MRVTENTTYHEDRDAVSHDWIRFINAVIPESIIIPIVNSPECAKRLLQSGLDGVILTNGEDVGSIPLRDKTEAFVLQECIRQLIPVFGACRGLQVINSFFDGITDLNLERINGVSHVGKNHNVNILTTPIKHIDLPMSLEVNSFHHNGVMKNSIGKGLKSFALSPEGVVEGLFHQEYPMIAVQWHPERNNPSTAIDKQLIKNIFNIN